MVERDTMRRSGTRRHMGTATSDPDYLPQTDFQRRQDRMDLRRLGAERAAAREAAGTSEDSRREPLHGERYLSTPKSSKSIFTRRERKRRRTQLILTALLVVAIALILAWFFFLR